jgi:hypothetical protein
LAVAELSRTQPPAQSADAACRTDALALLRSLQPQLSRSAEMAGKLHVLEQALQQVRRQHQKQNFAVCYAASFAAGLATCRCQLPQQQYPLRLATQCMTCVAVLYSFWNNQV